MLSCIFWLSIFLVVYTYALYPAVLWLVSKLFGRKHVDESTAMLHDDELPAISVVISAYNEEQHIRQRVENLLSLDYPSEKLHILIGSDGSKDKTSEILHSIEDHRLQFFDFQENRGKASVLNDLVSRATTDIIVMSDANTEFMPDNLRRLVCHFNDGNVGVVCGELDLYDPSAGKNNDSLYWRLERFLKYHEGKIDGLLGANGANYAIRKSLFKPIPKNTIVDDFVIVMRVAEQGYRVAYDKSAIAREEVAPDETAEFKRRVRIGTGNYQAFFWLLGFLNPLKGMRFFTYVSHKVLRWFVPHLLIIALLSSLLLIKVNMLYGVLFVLQLAMYVFYFAVYRMQLQDVLPKLLRFPFYILLLNAGFLKGFWRYITGEVSGSWARSDR